MPDIHVSAAVIVDEEGRVLVVRKQGTTRFMQPGGKPEPGESAAQTLIRELDEELGVVLEEADLRPLGTFVSEAANEPGHRVVAEAFAASVAPDAVTVQAELAELRWITPADVTTLPLAPLSVEHLLPIAWPTSAG
ncbi:MULTISPECIES: NUDIX domain-containing protein [unclassified Microbacterium]|uniref:NUDIX hydrolase n=1 Tax=unclassified Microbacterium TaxID=2609290 RepID=UPI000CFD558D|nr:MULTISPECIES: NUDIX domain-containing protein [unclassified Microbacterium]PQZ49906.1 NUDIX hydrolase [Microbacterium sp. MYb43]PQZ72549.1 NUDIX hydrolase [Microbacterium sp. MYb40]PRB14896.1 NUDIX hydrolase [Microbacterium sp. MYb54]PRB21666.1 NUDIX hydrolase [Microbacterium sp. MYb50]PRB64122.1 NUDIX hydrolase [Microbacterium sp. MYb24]